MRDIEIIGGSLLNVNRCVNSKNYAEMASNSCHLYDDDMAMVALLEHPVQAPFVMLSQPRMTRLHQGKSSLQDDITCFRENHEIGELVLRGQILWGTPCVYCLSSPLAGTESS